MKPMKGFGDVVGHHNPSVRGGLRGGATTFVEWIVPSTLPTPWFHSDHLRLDENRVEHLGQRHGHVVHHLAAEATRPKALVARSVTELGFELADRGDLAGRDEQGLVQHLAAMSLHTPLLRCLGFTHCGAFGPGKRSQPLPCRVFRARGDRRERADRRELAPAAALWTKPAEGLLECLRAPGWLGHEVRLDPVSEEALLVGPQRAAKALCKSAPG
eukprot:8842899-Lingulodinium_polyedra.AAC.1